jgi:hypothetical protein
LPRSVAAYECANRVRLVNAAGGLAQGEVWEIPRASPNHDKGGEIRSNRPCHGYPDSTRFALNIQPVKSEKRNSVMGLTECMTELYEYASVEIACGDVCSDFLNVIVR